MEGKCIETESPAGVACGEGLRVARGLRLSADREIVATDATARTGAR